MSAMNRRDALRTGGLVVALGAIAAACGEDGEAAPGRIGIAPPPATLPTVESPASDVTILRTAQSLEYTALEIYAALLATGELSGDETAVFEAIVADHERHAAMIGELVVGAGGEEYACANTFFTNRSVTPTLDAMEGSDDPHRDVLNIAFAFESMFGSSYQSFVGRLSDPALRQAMLKKYLLSLEAATITGREERLSPPFKAAFETP